jgi:hypothetical protein
MQADEKPWRERLMGQSGEDVRIEVAAKTEVALRELEDEA